MRHRGIAALIAVVGLAGTPVARATGEAAPPGESPTVAAIAAPTPSPARLGKPTSIVAVGDSITQSTGTGALSAENPKNSWATGWEVNSYAERLGVPTSARYNLAKNGARMTHMVGELRDGKSGGSGDVPPMPSTAGLVMVEFGGNDLCRDSVAEMTSVADYRSQFQAGLAQIATQAPDALVQVMSIPDIYNLWYIRGAPYDPVFHPHAQSDQATGINGAQFYWKQSFFPCQSLLTNPDSYLDSENQRRAAVRQRNMEYNQVLAEECAKVLRCRFDGNKLFDWSSNRISPPYGQLLPQEHWNLTDLDISRNTVSLCPIPGLVGGGCGDHFHPSKQGQGKIADVAWQMGRDWTDATFPTAGGTVLPSTRPDGLNHGRATVRFTGADDKGLRGQEVRVHYPDGTVSPWKASIGVAPDLTVEAVGRAYVEVRSLDVNGNRSAGTVIPVDLVDPLLPGTPGAPTIAATTSGLKVSWSAPADDGGGTIARYDLASFAGAPPAAEGAPLAVTGGRTATIAAPTPGAVLRYRVSAVNPTGAGPSSSASGATVAPFASLAAFVTRQYQDFVGRAPTTAERDTAVAALDAGTQTPAQFVDGLRANPWYDGAYGPATRLYRAYFLRVPDPSGLEYWATKRRQGRTLSKISQQFSVSSEFVRRYGSLTDTDFIDTIYRNVFNRAPDSSGRSFYLRKLGAGWSRGQVVLQFSESSEYKRLTTPLVTVIELARGLDGKAPDQVAIEYKLLDLNTGGLEVLFGNLIGQATYRSRVIA
jgi:lysophospholipase L1-like esterase